MRECILPSMRQVAAGALLALGGSAYTVLTRDRAGLVVASPVTLLFYRMLSQARDGQRSNHNM